MVSYHLRLLNNRTGYFKSYRFVYPLNLMIPMTIVARLDSLAEAYLGMETLRQNAISPDLSRNGDQIVLSVDDDFAENAKNVLTADIRFAGKNICCEATSRGSISYDDYNA